MTRPILDLGSWCILQAHGADTLRVVEALIEEGLGVWTPLKWRQARTKIIRSRYDEPRPILPGYVFGDVGHIDQFVRLAGLRRRDFPRFWFLEDETQAGATPLVADRDLNGLREYEAVLRAQFEADKRKGVTPPTFEPATEVRMEEGAYAGLSGEVVEMRGRGCAMVAIPGFASPVKVSSLLLLESVAKDELPYSGAARAA